MGKKRDIHVVPHTKGTGRLGAKELTASGRSTRDAARERAQRDGVEVDGLELCWRAVRVRAIFLVALGKVVQSAATSL